MNVGRPVGKNKEYWKVMLAILKSMRCLMGSQWSCWRRVRGLQDSGDRAWRFCALCCLGSLKVI